MGAIRLKMRRSVNIKKSTVGYTDQKSAVNTGWGAVAASFALFAVYGFILLLSSYTGSNILHTIGKGKIAQNGALAVVPQAAGLVLGVLFLKFITKNFTLRAIMIAG